METLLILGALALLARGKHPADAVATGDKGSGGGMTTGVYKGPMTRDGRPCPPEMIVDLQCIKPPCGQMCNEPVLKTGPLDAVNTREQGCPDVIKFEKEKAASVLGRLGWDGSMSFMTRCVYDSKTRKWGQVY
jgi:hypothetical protein